MTARAHMQLSVFAADFIQAVGAVMDIRWANKGLVEVGTFCTAQGALQQLGETTVALSTLVSCTCMRITYPTHSLA